MPKDKAVALIVRLIDRYHFRVGNDEYARDNRSYGLTTLHNRHVTIDGSRIEFRFRGKSGKRQSLDIDDAELAVVVAALAVVVAALAAGRPAAPLLAYTRGRRRVPLTPKDVNAYVRAMTGGAFTAKDFRTLRGTILAADALARIGPAGSKRDRKHAEVLAVKAASDALGNTPAVARSSYIDPRVFARYRRGVVLDTAVSPESAIRALILG